MKNCSQFCLNGWDGRWVQTGPQDLVKDDHNCLVEVKIKETKGKRMQDFDNWPLNTMPLNTGSTVLTVSQEEWLNLLKIGLNIEMIAKNNS